MVEAALLGAAFVAGLVGTMAGFGTSVIFISISLLFLDFQTALMLAAFFLFFGNLSRVTFFRHGLNKGVIIFFGIPSIIFTAVGALLVSYTPQNILTFLLGVFLIGFSILSLWDSDFHFAPSERNSMTGGTFSGLVTGLLGTGGPLIGAFLLGFKMRKTTYIATISAVYLAMDIVRIPIYVSSGYLAAEHVQLLIPLFVIAIVSSWLGKKVVNRIPRELFRKGVFISLILFGVKFVLDSGLLVNV